MKTVNFNKPFVSDKAINYLASVLDSKQFENGFFTKNASAIIKELCQVQHVLLTNSCTSALELAALLIDVKVGDEIIMPSYTFVSTANAFVLRGAVPVFIDIRADTLNMDEQLIEAAITSKTKAIVPVHYAGVGCDMSSIMRIAKKHHLFVIEDAAQGILASYNHKPLGSFGHMSALSFHHTKNIGAGLGGALLINDESLIERAKIIWQKGTNREAFLEGIVDKYTWVDIGSSFMPSELSAALLFSHLQESREITEKRRTIWECYFDNLRNVSGICLPSIPEACEHNAHMFYFILDTPRLRSQLLSKLRACGIEATFHYIPLHLSEKGRQFSINFPLPVTERIASSIVRLPLHYYISNDDIQRTINVLLESF